jgi:hypothetical protein
MLVEIMLSGNMLSVWVLEVPYLDFDRNISANLFIAMVPLLHNDKNIFFSCFENIENICLSI